MAQAQPRIVHDAGGRADPLSMAVLPATRSEMALPLISRRQVIGAMTIQSSQAAAFRDEDLTGLQTLAGQLSNAIANARLYAAAQLEIAERKRAEEALKEYSERLQEMVEQRTQELREAQEQLIRRERLEVLGQLAGGVGHELRNPLGVISNAVYYLKMVIPDSDQAIREYLDIISSEVLNAEKIVSDLLDFSRTTRADKETPAVSDLVNQALAKRPLPQNVEVMAQFAADLPPVFVDPRQIRQVLVNLISNACDAMPGGGRLIIGAQADGDRLALSVTDTGCGIPQENLRKVFEPLFTTKAKGIGLGLAVSRSLAEVNGGTIEVHSPSPMLQPAQGTTFTLVLPTREKAA
jgi:signal transduction histidine kinase